MKYITNIFKIYKYEFLPLDLCLNHNYFSVCNKKTEKNYFNVI